MMFSTPSYGEWTKVSETVNGDTVYVDFERIKKHGGYVYWWDLMNNLKPTTTGTLSVKSYHQGDCKVFPRKPLTGIFYKESMGEGTGNVLEPPPEYKVWKYPIPNSIDEVVLKAVCNH